MHNFLTNKSTTSFLQIWLMIPIMVGIPLLRFPHNLISLLFAVSLTLIILLFVILPFKRPLQVRIDTYTKQLHYLYQNCFGAEQTLIVDLQNVDGYFERKRLGKLQANWRLVLLNGKGLYRKLSLEENNGYTRDQLESIMQLVQDCKAT